MNAPANDDAKPTTVATGAVHLHSRQTNVEAVEGDVIFVQRNWLDALADMPTPKVLTLAIELGLGLATGVAIFAATLSLFFLATDWMIGR